MQGFLFVAGSVAVIVGFVALVAGTLQWRGVTGRKTRQPSTVPLA
jgi:hypothetical protein